MWIFTWKNFPKRFPSWFHLYGKLIRPCKVFWKAGTGGCYNNYCSWSQEYRPTPSNGNSTRGFSSVSSSQSTRRVVDSAVPAISLSRNCLFYQLRVLSAVPTSTIPKIYYLQRPNFPLHDRQQRSPLIFPSVSVVKPRVLSCTSQVTVPTFTRIMYYPFVTILVKMGYDDCAVNFVETVRPKKFFRFFSFFLCR